MLSSDLWNGWFAEPEVQQEYNDYLDKLYEENENDDKN